MNGRDILMRLRAGISEFMFGAAMSWVLVPYTLKRRAELERIFIFLTASYLEGVPVMPPSAALRLLPYLVPQILYWRRRLALWDEALESADLKHLGH